MATLDRALPFSKMDRVSKLVSDYLKLNVPRPLDELFQVAMWRAKRAEGFRLGRFQSGEQLAAASNDAHASPASAGNSLNDHRIPNRFGDCNGLFVRVNGVRASGQNQKPKPVHLPAGAGLVPHQANGFGRRTDEFDLAGLTDFSKVSALREKAISGMDGIDVRDLGGANDARYVQVAVRAPGRANTNCLVRKAYMQRVPVRFREHGNGLDAEFLTRVNNSEGYFSAVSDEYFLEHRLSGTNGEQIFAIFYRLPVFDQNADDLPSHFRFDLVHELHRLDDAHDGSFFHDVTNGHKRIGGWRRCPVKGSHDRRFHIEQFLAFGGNLRQRGRRRDCRDGGGRSIRCGGR